MLVAVERAVAALGISADAVGLVEGSEASEATVAIQRGRIRIGVADRGSHLHVFCRITVDESEQATLLRLSPSAWSKVSAALEGTIRDGRTFGYLDGGPENHERTLRALVIEQRIVVQDDSPITFQRITDGIQEVTVVSIRVARIIARALREDEAGRSERPPSPPETMYG